MDTLETHFRSIVNETGASRSLTGFDMADLGIAYIGNMMANENSAILSALGAIIDLCRYSGDAYDDDVSMAFYIICTE